MNRRFSVWTGDMRFKEARPPPFLYRINREYPS